MSFRAPTFGNYTKAGSLFKGINYILGRRPKKHMFWVYTIRDIATVTYAQTLWDLPVNCLIDPAVSVYAFTFEMKAAVTRMIYRAQPKPTMLGLVNFSKKIIEVIANLSHCVNRNIIFW